MIASDLIASEKRNHCSPPISSPFSTVSTHNRHAPSHSARDERALLVTQGRVEMWRGGGRSNISVSASFVWRCLTGSTVTPFPHPAHRTGQADLPHPALGQYLTPSPTARRAQARSGVRARSARKDAGVDKSRPCVV